jgi:uncharacterized protein involved in exopolysaccharide biosynthesis/Mrp family chromosome partitioning ATPase
MIKSYWLRLLLFAVIGAAIGLGASLASPYKYESVLQIMIDQPLGAAVPATSEAINSVSDLYNTTRGRTVTTQVEQLTSWDVVRTAAKNAAAQQGLNENEPEFDFQNIQQSLIVSAEATSDIITLRVRMSKPEYAKSVAFEIYKAFEAKNTANAKAIGSQVVESLENLQRTLKVQLDGADLRLEHLRENGLGVDAQAMTTQEVQSLYSLENAVAGLEIEQAAALENIRSIESELARRKADRIIGGTTVNTPNPIIEGLKAQLAQHRAERESLLVHYMEDHEAVRAKDIQIAELESQMAKLPKTVPQGSQQYLDPIKQSLTAQLTDARVKAATTTDRLATARSELAKKANRQQTIPKLQTEYQRILREMAALERRYTDTTAAVEGFRGIQRGRQAPVQLITAPEAFPEPVSPRHPINVLFGFVGGLILGVLSMLSTEGKRQPIRSLAQLNSLAAQPVYRIIPELRMPFRGLNKAPAEPYETLLVNFRRSDKRPYRLGIVGITKDSGASITSLNVALAGEKHGNRALIVETDPRSTIKRLLSRQGMAVEGLLTKVSPNVTLYSTDALRQVQNADGTTSFGNDVSDLETDLTVFDFEPSTESAEYAFAASHLDEMIVLVRAEKTKSVEFLHAQQALAESGCPLVTVVFVRSSDLQLVTESTVSYEQPKALAQ